MEKPHLWLFFFSSNFSTNDISFSISSLIQMNVSGECMGVQARRRELYNRELVGASQSGVGSRQASITMTTHNQNPKNLYILGYTVGYSPHRVITG